MDKTKTLLKAYIRTIVEEEVQRLVPKMLEEAINEIKAIKGKPINETTTVSAQSKKPVVDKARLAQLLGIDYDRDNGVITAGVTSKTSMVDAPDMPGMVMGLDSAGNKIPIPKNKVATEVLDAINRDYSALVKQMKL
jgi:hypothetical protein